MERSFGLVSTLIRYCFVFSLRLVTRILLVSSASCGISFIVTGRCDYFGFDFTILIRKLLYVVRVPGGGGGGGGESSEDFFVFPDDDQRWSS